MVDTENICWLKDDIRYYFKKQLIHNALCLPISSLTDNFNFEIIYATGCRYRMCSSNRSSIFWSFSMTWKTRAFKTHKKCILVNCRRWLKAMHANYSKQKAYAMSKQHTIFLSTWFLCWTILFQILYTPVLQPRMLKEVLDIVTQIGPTII